MDIVPEPIDPETAALITKRLELSLQFAKEVIANPARLDDIPPFGSIVVVVPADDPEFAAHELAFAERLTAEGKTVIVKQVGVEPITEEGWARLNAKMPAWAPVWATDLDPEAAAVVYDQGRDALLVDLAGGRRQGWGWPANDLVYLLLDEETEEAFAYLVPNFLADVVRGRPELARILAVAELRPLTEAERGQLQILESPPDNGAGRIRSSGAMRNARAAFLADVRHLADLAQVSS